MASMETPSFKRKLETDLSSHEPHKLPKLDATEEEDVDDETNIDDEEGRFFGGGITSGTAEILDFIDDQDAPGVKTETIDAAWVGRLALKFKRSIERNSEMRAKFQEDPQKFEASEADLEGIIKSLSSLCENPELYGDFVRLECVEPLVSLLAHENTDIATEAIEIISELTDEDVEAGQQWNDLVDSMLQVDLLNLLSQNLARFDESDDSDRSGVYYTLNVFENLASSVPLLEKIGSDTTVISWILGRLKTPESPVTQNKQYAAELLAILLQGSSVNRHRLIELDGIDLMLQILSAYRKRDPLKDTSEEEYFENIFDCMTCLVEGPAGRNEFVKAEGVELCLIMLREGMMSRPRSLRLLNHSVGGSDAGNVCEKVVEAAGLKPIFSLFMKKQDRQTVEHLLGIISGLLRFLPSDSAPRIRTMAKFVEKDYEKISRLVKLRREYASRVRHADTEILREQSGLAEEEISAREDEWFSRRLDAGLFCLQTVDVILAWLVAEDDGAKNKIQALFADQDETLTLVKASLQDQLNTMDEPEGADDHTRKMLSALLQFF